MTNAESKPGGLPEPAAPTAPDRMCEKHPGRPGRWNCIDCGGAFCDECVFHWEGDPICRACIREYRASESHLEGIAGTEEEEWKPASLFTFRMFRTILLRPREFFEAMPRGRGIAEPVFFAFSWGILLMLLSAPANYLTLKVLVWKASFFGPVTGYLGAKELVDLGFWTFVVSVPAHTMLTIMGLFLVAAVQHVLLFALGRRSRFELTVRITFFSIAAQSLAIVPIPLAAMLAAEVYGIVLQVLGFRKVYDVGTASAVLIALLPPVLIVLLMAGLGGT
jgi:hypothetical protein